MPSYNRVEFVHRYLLKLSSQVRKSESLISSELTTQSSRSSPLPAGEKVEFFSQSSSLQKRPFTNQTKVQLCTRLTCDEWPAECTHSRELENMCIESLCSALLKIDSSENQVWKILTVAKPRPMPATVTVDKGPGYFQNCLNPSTNPNVPNRQLLISKTHRHYWQK